MPAIALARARGITVHVFEEGYLRPYWVTYDAAARTAFPAEGSFGPRHAGRLGPIDL